MAINKVNTETQEQDFRFLTNQSSILHTVETNDITVNGVNVIVDKPKRGDVMYISNQKVIWIDGLSINPKQLPQEYEPVGICLVVNGNKALVRYRREEIKAFMGVHRFLMDVRHLYNHDLLYLDVLFDDNLVASAQAFSYNDLKDSVSFANRLNEIFSEKNIPCFAESTDETGWNYSDFGLVVINCAYTRNPVTFRFYNEYYNFTPTLTKLYFNPNIINTVNYCYRKNGFKANKIICCKAKTYDWTQSNQTAPTTVMTSINNVPGGDWDGECPVRKIDFYGHTNCAILRSTFASYDEYLDSMMIKYPCGAGGAVAKFPSGKKDTYKLSEYTFYNYEAMEEEPLYYAAYLASSISFNAPNLGKGNWWLPSVAEMAQIMRDVTYGTSFWTSKPDIINRVLAKLTSIDKSGWSMLSASTNRWTSSIYNQNLVYIYHGANYGYMFNNNLSDTFSVAPITIYEFE